MFHFPWSAPQCFYTLGHQGLLDGVIPFGNRRIVGCWAPPRRVSPPNCVLHRFLQSRHPPHALIQNLVRNSGNRVFDFPAAVYVCRKITATPCLEVWTFLCLYNPSSLSRRRFLHSAREDQARRDVDLGKLEPVRNVLILLISFQCKNLAISHQILCRSSVVNEQHRYEKSRSEAASSSRRNQLRTPASCNLLNQHMYRGV